MHSGVVVGKSRMPSSTGLCMMALSPMRRHIGISAIANNFGTHSIPRLIDTIIKAKGAKRAKNEALYGETEGEMNAGTKLRLV